MELSLSLLIELIDKGYNKKRIADITGAHYNTIVRWIKNNNLEIKVLTECKCCGVRDDALFEKGRYTFCKKCRKRRDYLLKKLKAVEYKGGKCSECGYNKCIASLDFHHTDPTQKEYQWNKLRNKSLLSIYKEIDKCKLLCKNCHSEFHWNQNNSESAEEIIRRSESYLTNRKYAKSK